MRKRLPALYIVLLSLVLVTGFLGETGYAARAPLAFRVWEGTPATGLEWDTALNGKISIFKKGSLPVSTPGDFVLAPGSQGSYVFTIENITNGEMVYKLTATETNPYEVPIEVRLKNDTGTYVMGDDSSWVPIREGLAYKGTIPSLGTQEFLLSWRWEFEVGDERNARDTTLGRTVAEGKTIPYDLTLSIVAQDYTVAPDPKKPATSKNVSTGEDLVLPGSLAAIFLMMVSAQHLIRQRRGKEARRG